MKNKKISNKDLFHKYIQLATSNGYKLKNPSVLLRSSIDNKYLLDFTEEITNPNFIEVMGQWCYKHLKYPSMVYSDEQIKQKLKQITKKLEDEQNQAIKNNKLKEYLIIFFEEYLINFE